MSPDPLFEQRLAALARLPADLLRDPYLIGLEKEALRVTPQGKVATSAHPKALGSALTHPYITTDFSEALIELVTPAVATPAAALEFLNNLHLFVYRHIGDERLWATSMPCVIGGSAAIPLAYYGDSNAGQMKTIYRRGLGNRYGRVMQVIAGVHFNFSLRENLWPLLQDAFGREKHLPADTHAFRDALYMGMVRNLQRLGWLVPYLFGASPAVCKSFVQGEPGALASFDDHTYYHPFGTSLRMGDIGYQNRQEEGTGMKASYDSLDAYVRSLTWAIETPCPQYENLGVKVAGRYEQLNDHVLQIENEYYSTVRPKQLTEGMERPTLALRRRGIRYVELRSVDVNAFHPLGIDEEQLHFLATFMLHSLLCASPRINARERRAIDSNEVTTAHRGREPELALERETQAIHLRTWAGEVLSQMGEVAALLDGGPTGPHQASVQAQQEKIREPNSTPSARMLAEMRAQGEGFATFARRLTEVHRQAFQEQQLPEAAQRELEALSAESIAKQKRIEAEDQRSLDEFLADYFNQGRATEGLGKSALFQA
ncbi:MULTISPECIES: glutamate--cysteine ligase [Thiorhodovibrio]|uniref:glutamate--cysteine ligase n=1 Tax=Thiorhodovibrio TaxID=61593 RepID=UPI001913A2C7|nr:MULTISPECIES: glutamate--cysteine ligase [Thiorhodovibrio]MBK5969218.1 glutamate--cysteine ligase [Thiorhodovibrio winogradskyi]WPL11210.1 Glutamate--cysteine ligase [Thiorhodovibrio litoralis]